MDHFGMTEIARLLDCSPRTVSNWVDSGKLEGYRLPSGYRRVKRDDFIKFCLDNKIPVPQTVELFDEKSLYTAIKRVWGPKGAHTETFEALCKKAGVNLE